LKWPSTLKRGIFIFLCLGAFIMGYEFLQNFLMWTSFFIMYGGQLGYALSSVEPCHA
jgi:hypothetical protein